MEKEMNMVLKPWSIWSGDQENGLSDRVSDWVRKVWQGGTTAGEIVQNPIQIQYGNLCIEIPVGWSSNYNAFIAATETIGPYQLFLALLCHPHPCLIVRPNGVYEVQFANKDLSIVANTKTVKIFCSLIAIARLEMATKFEQTLREALHDVVKPFEESIILVPVKEPSQNGEAINEVM
jgi:hypothetical protein